MLLLIFSFEGFTLMDLFFDLGCSAVAVQMGVFQHFCVVTKNEQELSLGSIPQCLTLLFNQ